MSRMAEYVLRAGLAFAFLYPPYSAVTDSNAWIGFFPQFMRDIAGNDILLLHAFGLLEVAIALWIIFGRDILIPSSIAAGMLVAIIVFNWGAIDILFRDISILAIALAVAFEHWHRRRQY